MSAKPLFHPETEREIKAFIEAPSHALGLFGQAGAGKQFVAHYVAEQLLGTGSLTGKQHVVLPEPMTISIEAIRSMQEFLKLKAPGTAKIRRVVIVVDADCMTSEAQNALLKTLEEPPSDTVIILTATRHDALQKTIASRLQHIRVRTPALSDAVNYFNGGSEDELRRAYALSNGAIGLLHSLISGDESQLSRHITTAKELYGLTAYERLARVDELSKDKDNLPGLLYASKRIATAALESAALKDDTAQVQRWHERLQLIVDSEHALSRNANPKLLLTNLFIQI